MRKRVFNCLMSIVFLSLMKTAHAVETRDPLEVFYGRLTPQGRAKLGVSREKLMAEGHEIARVFLSPLAKKGPLPLAKIQTETTTTERKDRNRFLSERLKKHQLELLGGYTVQELGVQLIGNGEMLLCDPGYYSYSGEGEGGAYSKYFTSTAAHNTALVDGQNQISYAVGTRAEANTQAGDYNWQNAPDGASAQGVYNYGFGAGGKIKVLHRRKVQFLPAQSTFEIVDSFENQNGGREEHDIALMWQLAPGSETKIGVNSVAVERPKARLRMELTGAPNAKIEQFMGQKEPLSGWFSQTYGKLEAAPTLRVSTRAALPLTITTKLIVEKK